HARQVEERQRGAVHRAAQGRTPPGRQAQACFQKGLPFVAGQDAGYEGLPVCTEKAGRRNRRPRFLKGEKTAELAYAGKALPPVTAVALDVRPDDVFGNHRVFRVESGRKEAVEDG